MRLIEADALIDDIQRYANEPIKLNDRRWDTKCAAIIQDMIGTVKLQPTIEARPVRHGRWIDGKVRHIKNGELRNMRECSECGALYFVYDEYNSKEDKPKYCPNCGAKMDGDEE